MHDPSHSHLDPEPPIDRIDRAPRRAPRPAPRQTVGGHPWPPRLAEGPVSRLNIAEGRRLASPTDPDTHPRTATRRARVHPLTDRPDRRRARPDAPRRTPPPPPPPANPAHQARALRRGGSNKIGATLFRGLRSAARKN